MYGMYGKLPGPRPEYVAKQRLKDHDVRRKRSKRPPTWG